MQLGKMINIDKSTAIFSKGTKQAVKQTILGVLGILRESWNKRYPILPVHLGASKAKEFAYLNDRIWQLIHGWEERLLACKEILIEVVA
jgi:hypothetical protein